MAGTPGTWAQSGGGGMTNPMTTAGDVIIGGSSGTPNRLAGDTSNSRKLLRTQASGGVAQAPAWDILQAADVPTLNQNTTGTAASVSGTVPLAHGGTGQVTQQAAMDALSGTQSAGKYLRSDGTHATLQPISAGDVPTLNQSTTGTAANVSGTVGLANGGTGQVTQQAAIDALTGTQTAGTYLRSSGTHAALAAIQAADVPTLNQNTTGTAANITDTLDQVPAPAAAVSLNSKKITNLANGTASTDAVAFGQIPSLDSTATDIAALGAQAAG